MDLLNAVAAITGGGAFIVLGQLAGVAGLAWILFRTAFGGSWKDNAKWILLFVAVWGAMVVPKATVRVVDRLDPSPGPRRRRQRPHRPRPLLVPHQPGRGRIDQNDGTGLRPPGRPRLPPPRVYFRLKACRRRDRAGDHGRGVRPEPEKLRRPVRFSCAAAGACLGGRAEGIHRHLGPGHGYPLPLRRRLPRPHVFFLLEEPYGDRRC